MDSAPPSGWTDTLLLREIRASGMRRNKAWEYIYKAWRGYYLSPVLAAGGTVAEVDEILGKVVMDVEQQILRPDFELRTTTLRSYFTVGVLRAWSKAREHAQCRKMVEFDPDIHAAGHRDSVEEEFIRQERIQRVEAQLERLGDKCRTILMCFARGYSMREIAGEMGFDNEQSAKNAKLRCHRKLLDLIDEC